MNILTMFGFFGSFALGGSIANALLRSRVPTLLLVLVAPILIAVNYVLMMAMTFHGQAFELMVIATSGVALGFPLAVFFRTGEKLEKERAKVEFKDGRGKQRFPLRVVATLALCLPALVITMTTLLSRLNEAAWLEWKCDGRVVEVTRNKGNHNNPVLVVETGGVKEKFEMIDGGLWSRAKPGQHLSKQAGSPIATLDGEPVRMVPLQTRWWNEPK